ncbi:MAG: DNA polymerase III subunit delta [Oscillospiraceae bacterium]|nr:DNA polymerase III subunit delta [Oscillospiraceae bacterium]
MDYSKSKTKDNNETYKNFTAALKAGSVSKFIILHGEERYLLEHSLGSLRTILCPDGLDSFNYKRFDGKGIPVEELNEAIETFPAFAERTLIEVHDFDIFASPHRERMSEILASLPDYVCVVFIYSTIEFKPDGRLKATKEVLKFAEVVEFNIQDKGKLINWISKHFVDAGKSISPDDAEYLAYITGGLMTSLIGEIKKVAAFSKNERILRSDIDAVVTPVLDAVAYRLTDAIINRNHKRSIELLDELFQMREAPHKLIYSISLKLRQLLAAKVCSDKGIGKTDFMNLCGIRFDIQARSLIDAARNTSIKKCRTYLLECCKTALELNSTAEPEARILELVVRLAVI